MMKFLLPLMASIFVAILPFLFIAEDFKRGIFGFSELGLLLLFVWLKNCLAQEAKHIVLKMLLICGMVLVCASMVGIAWVDILNMTTEKKVFAAAFGFLPLVSCGLALAIVWKVPRFDFSTICAIMLGVLFVHLAASNLYPQKDFARFPVLNYVSLKKTPEEVNRKVLPSNFETKFNADFYMNTMRKHVDMKRSNVFVLVESWGVFTEMERMDAEFAVFDGVSQKIGLHPRASSDTKKAEQEDMLFVSTSNGDSVFWPQKLVKQGYSSVFLFGGDSTEFDRYKYLREIGFEKKIWKDPDFRLPYVKDLTMADKIDSILKENDQEKKLIAWTTTDTKFPLSGFIDPYSVNPDVLDSACTERLMNTLQVVADLARKNPEVRFIVHGDHEPILSPRLFQERFFKHWVPFVVLN